jgi:hypothetical protein
MVRIDIEIDALYVLATLGQSSRVNGATTMLPQSPCGRPVVVRAHGHVHNESLQLQ